MKNKYSRFIIIGCGKTKLGAYAAAETGSALIRVSAAALMDKYVGGTSRNVKALFDIAAQLKKAIIYIDEVSHFQFPNFCESSHCLSFSRLIR